MTEADPTRSVAGRVAAVAAGVLGRDLPIRVRAWDGSESGPTGGPVLVLHHRRALRRLLRSPGESGFTEAYLEGDVEIEGDLSAALSALWALSGDQYAARPRIAGPRRPRLVAAVARLGVLGPWPPAPGPAGRRRLPHSGEPAGVPRREQLPVAFFELLLGASMTDTSQNVASDSAADQQGGLDMICRQLGLGPGSTHLDLGCGWGSLICHAAEHYGTRSIGVTRSRQQYDYIQRRVADAGLGDRVHVRLADHREPGATADAGQFDAVSAVAVEEYISAPQYPAFTDTLQRVLKPGGRALVQQVTCGPNPPPGDAFVGTYIAPDVSAQPVGSTVSLLGTAGLEVREVHALGEYYDRTLRARAESLERSWNGAVDLIGEVGARAWRLYLVGGALAFAERRLGVDQILAVRPVAPQPDPSQPIRG